VRNTSARIVKGTRSRNNRSATSQAPRSTRCTMAKSPT